jgi:hypothetical protein
LLENQLVAMGDNPAANVLFIKVNGGTPQV